MQILTVRDENGVDQTLKVTEEHPFYRDSDGWTPARKLESGDMLLGADGTLTVVANEHEAHPNGVTVYNLEVEQAHTYFVLAEDAHDAAAVWVHNASGYDPDEIAKQLDDAFAKGKANMGRLSHKASASSPRAFPDTELVDIRRLSPSPSRPVADPTKVFKAAPFDWAKYSPIELSRVGTKLQIDNGMTRVALAQRAGITHLPAKVK